MQSFGNEAELPVIKAHSTSEGIMSACILFITYVFHKSWLFIVGFISLSGKNWSNEWQIKAFRRNIIIAVLLLPVILVSTHFFFDFIQSYKGGVILNDWVLKWLPARDVSRPICFFMTSVIILCLLRCISNPTMFLIAIMGFILLFAARIITISTTRLLAPRGLIDLRDPVCNLVYGATFITRDLFFSGHTATLFLLFLCSYKKIDRHYILFAVVSVGFLLLVQHVHYTVDVVCAPLFAFGCFWVSKKIMRMQGINIKNHSLRH